MPPPCAAQHTASSFIGVPFYRNSLRLGASFLNWSAASPKTASADKTANPVKVRLAARSSSAAVSRSPEERAALLCSSVRVHSVARQGANTHSD